MYMLLSEFQDSEMTHDALLVLSLFELIFIKEHGFDFITVEDPTLQSIDRPQG